MGACMVVVLDELRHDGHEMAVVDHDQVDRSPPHHSGDRSQTATNLLDDDQRSPGDRVGGSAARACSTRSAEKGRQRPREPRGIVEPGKSLGAEPSTGERLPAPAYR